MALSTNLVAYYALDESSGNAIDSLGSNDLTDNNTVGSGTGKVSGARHFTKASSQYFNHADNATLSVGDIDWSIIAWFNQDSTGRMMIASKDTGSSGEWYLYINNSNLAVFEVYGASGFASGTSLQASTQGVLSTATWYMAAAVHDSINNQLLLSINAGTQDTAAHTAGILDGTGDFRIANDSFAEPFDGLIDEVGIWKRTLSTTEISDLYNSGSGRNYAYISGGAAITKAQAIIII